jgi:hypothetical protein
VQVVDRLHLVQNLREALERFFLRHRRDLNTLGASLHQSSELTPTPAMLSRARLARWVHRYHEIQRLRAQQLGIAAIARRVQVSRPTVYRYLAMPQPPETLLAHLFRLGPVMIATYHHVQAFCRMVRQRRGDEFDAWVTAVQQTILFIGESGCSPLPSVARTDAPVGQTPVLWEWWTRDHLSAISAISPEGKLYFHSQGHALNSTTWSDSSSTCCA